LGRVSVALSSGANLSLIEKIDFAVQSTELPRGLDFTFAKKIFAITQVFRPENACQAPTARKPFNQKTSQ
jgi:hypothetical protein